MKNQESMIVKDPNKILTVLRRYPLATVVTVLNQQVKVSHLPIVAERLFDGGIKLRGHLSTKNPQWCDIKGGASMTLIFNGPNTYINSNWYLVNDVSTWNYVAVHASGSPSLEESYEGIVNILKATTELSNETYDDKWDFHIPEDLRSEGDLVAAIGGFSIIPTSINARFKLSQSKSLEDQKNIIGELSKRKDENSRLIGNLMSVNVE